MFLLGHLGLTALAWRVRLRRLPVGWLLVGAVLPDVLDKPLGLLSGNGYGRLYGHTLLFALAILATAMLTRAARASGLALGVLGHLALDRLWEVPEVLLWPALGAFPQETWTLGRYAELGMTSWYVMGFELAGGAALALVAAWEWRRRRQKRPEEPAPA